MRILLRATGILLLLFLTVGFRPLSSTHHWSISKTDPTLWLKFCDGFPTSFDKYDFPAGDVLQNSTPDFVTLINSVINDYNQIGSSYLRLANYPADPNNPPAPQQGDTAFTKDLSSTRTIEVCTGNPSGVSSGQAQLKGTSSSWTGCTITLSDTTATRSAASFIGTLTHEIGHCMGLGHPQDTTHAIMSYFRESGIRLMIDDKMGLTYLYPEETSQSDEQATFGILGCDPK